MHNQGKHFVHFIVDAAHAAKVPIAVHLDHCIQPTDVEIALTYPFDSIMVDGSLFSEAENVEYVRDIVSRAAKLGVTIEAELGRMEGCEDGLPDLGLEEVFTNPDTVKNFVQETGVHFLAPSFGNVHGPYPPGGAEKWWQVDRCARSRPLQANDMTGCRASMPFWATTSHLFSTALIHFPMTWSSSRCDMVW